MQKDFRNYYQILEIEYTANEKEIVDGYEALNQKLNDAIYRIKFFNLGEEEPILLEIEKAKEAYTLLSDPIKKSEYDEPRKNYYKYNDKNFTSSEKETPEEREKKYILRNEADYTLKNKYEKEKYDNWMSKLSENQEIPTSRLSLANLAQDEVKQHLPTQDEVRQHLPTQNQILKPHKKNKCIII